ncbi:MAG TPA: pyrroline-5-carboxylate reductase [Gammaproteobacteria bacterium]|nr:pyrroline-5-carboxylate reductase [Gammaproteobacteria bacterium]
MNSDTIAFIGGGNMATSLIGGLVADGHPRDAIWVTDVRADKLEALQDRFRVNTTGDNNLAVRRAETVVLAVKPQVMPAVLADIGPSAKETAPLLVSIAAGVRERDILRGLAYDAAIVRTMPNTPALLRCGATALYANAFVSAEQRSRAENILRAVGITQWVKDESLLDAVTAVSGSGPAYYFFLMELMERIGVELGLNGETARALVLQTALGAARMASETGESPETLRRKVTSPGGTTEAALNRLDAGEFEAVLRQALEAARDRAVSLGDELGAG